RAAIVIYAVEHDRRYGKNHPGRRKLPFGEDMMNETAVHTAIAILQRMDVDKAEGRGSGLQDRVNITHAHPRIDVQQGMHKVTQIIRTCADELRKWVAFMISFTKKHAIRTQPRSYKTCVLDQNALEPDDLVRRQGVPSGLQDGTTPPFEAVPRGAFAFNLKTGPA